MARQTERPENACDTCGYTWYPRGKSRSSKCPECGSRRVVVVYSGQGSDASPATTINVGCGSVLGLGFILALGCCGFSVFNSKQQPVADGNRQLSPPAAPATVPTAKAEPPATVKFVDPGVTPPTIPLTVPKADPPKTTPTTRPEPVKPDIETTHVLVRADGKIPLAKSSEGLDLFVAAIAKGSAAVDSMTARGLAFQVDTNFPVRLDERGDRISYVTPVGGPHVGKSFAVESKYLTPKKSEN